MAPIKSQSSNIVSNRTGSKALASLSRRAITTRTTQKSSVLIDGSENLLSQSGKRKAVGSPVRNGKEVKRSALGNVTSSVLNAFDDGKKSAGVLRLKNDGTTKVSTKKTATQTIGAENNQHFVAPKQIPRPTKVVTRSSVRGAVENTKTASLVAGVKKVSISTTVLKGKKKTETQTAANQAKVIKTSSDEKLDAAKPNGRRISNEFELFDDDESYYMSALEDLATSSMRLSVGDLRRKSVSSNASESDSNITASTQFESTLRQDIAIPILNESRPVPDGVIDFDRENWDDQVQVSEYAMEIFNYLKEREEQFKIDAYLQRQPNLTSWMRTLLVDWMVEVQETFELNHETLYLAVKIVDIYLSKVKIEKEQLQLIGAAALFMACKFDERTPPLIEDFLYICDGAYKRPQLIRMEMDAFRTIGYDLGIPLSYRFLRRYARCGKVTMPELTLARYILEFSLMNYDMVTLSDSKVAAACLFMALRMNNKTGWNKTLEHFSGYNVDDFKSIIPLLNGPLHSKQRDANKTIRNKYMHKVFFEVSKIPLMTEEKLLQDYDHLETVRANLNGK